jgi:hypothetical protein
VATGPCWPGGRAIDGTPGSVHPALSASPSWCHLRGVDDRPRQAGHWNAGQQRGQGGHVAHRLGRRTFPAREVVYVPGMPAALSIMLIAGPVLILSPYGL